ncbi:MAG: hypothetical protein IJ661_00210 [Lachnospiraceae bacterium]|nr:hypothetical protein [Lachnospiraceae bacterium]
MNMIENILHLIILNFPILDSFNAVIRRPIALVVQNKGEIKGLVQKISPRGKIIDSTSKISSAKKIINRRQL